MNTSDRFSLGDTLSLILPYVPDELSAPQARPSLLRLAEHLPPIARVLLECRLGQASQVDLSLCASDSEIDKTLLQRYLVSEGGSSPGQESISRFVRWWCDQEVSDTSLKSAWFEYDVDGEFDSLPLPAVFLRLNALRDRPLSAETLGVADALECLQPGASGRLNSWLPLFPQAAIPTFVGVMLPRPSNAVRLNLAGLSAENAWDWLVEYGKPNPHSRTLFEDMYRLAGKPILAIDIDDAVGPRVGLECRPANDEASLAMFDILAAAGLCSDSTYQSMSDWPGSLSVLENGTDWPLHLALEALMRPNVGTSFLVRHINHVKLVFDQSGLSGAKVYLAFNHAVHCGDDKNGTELRDTQPGASESALRRSPAF